MSPYIGAQALRDDYPSAPLLNHCIWPYESGEVIVQCYNTLLTLSALLDVSDGIAVVQNEHLHTTVRVARFGPITRPALHNRRKTHGLKSTWFEPFETIDECESGFKAFCFQSGECRASLRRVQGAVGDGTPHVRRHERRGGETTRGRVVAGDQQERVSGRDLRSSTFLTFFTFSPFSLFSHFSFKDQLG